MVGEGVKPAILPVTQKGRVFYRARFTELSFEQAHKKCRALSALKTGCAVISPIGR